MFDIGFSELFMVALVALIVLGPERLPKAARFAGLWVRRARAQWASVKSELERELAAEELKQGLHDTQTTMREIKASVRAADMDARREFDAMRAAVDTPAVDAPVAEAPAVDTLDSGDADAGDDPTIAAPGDRRDLPASEAANDRT